MVCQQPGSNVPNGQAGCQDHGLDILDGLNPYGKLPLTLNGIPARCIEAYCIRRNDETK